MERLTRWNGEKYILPQGRTSGGESNWRRIAERLGAYEDTGLDPDVVFFAVPASPEAVTREELYAELDAFMVRGCGV